MTGERGGRPWAAVLGDPIEHSLSPVLHGAAYARLGLDWEYRAVRCAAADLPDVVAAARRDPAWRGFSLTMPLKETVLPLADSIEEPAARIGAANTLLPDGHGGLVAVNTDVAGLRAALDEVAPAAVGTAVLVGAGGTARAAVAALAARVDRLTVVARSADRARPVLELAEAVGVEARFLAWPAELPPAELVVQTAPAGAADGFAARWPAGAALVEALYDPWPTACAAAAAVAGLPVADGMAVLAGQAVGQVARMTGRAVPAALLRAAGQAALAERHARDVRPSGRSVPPPGPAA